MYKNALTAMAVGDAVGMPVEFMTRSQIKDSYGLIDAVLDPKISFIHSNLKKGSVTDDTEQNLYLIEQFCKDGRITMENTVEGLMRWVEETDAWNKGYIGPSSLRTLKAIKNDSMDPAEAGKGGLTCGAPMRVFAAALCADKSDVAEAVCRSTVPTHNTDLAVEAAMSVGFALRAAADGEDFEGIIKSSLEGAKKGFDLCDNRYVGASTYTRIKYILDCMSHIKDTDKFLDFLYYCIGTGMQANEVAPAVIGIFAWAKDDVWLSIRAGASVGGDTDTIAAVAGALSALYAKKLNIPAEITDLVIKANKLNLDKYNLMMIENQRG